VSVTLHYDDGSQIDFNDKGDALYHLKTQGVAGVVNLTENGKQVNTRKQLEDLLSLVADHGYETRADLNKLKEG
jgi:hypothetical protein